MKKTMNLPQEKNLGSISDLYPDDDRTDRQVSISHGVRSDHYYQKATDLHERERRIKAARGTDPGCKWKSAGR